MILIFFVKSFMLELAQHNCCRVSLYCTVDTTQLYKLLSTDPSNNTLCQICHPIISHYFSMYDVDGNGFIELSEMVKLVKSIFQMMNHTNAHRAHLNPSERARTIFRLMDKDGDGRVSRDEFINTCLAEPKILNLLTPPGT